MRVQDIMNPNVVTISPLDTATFANELMWRKAMHHLVVLDGNSLVGVISDLDLGGASADTIPDNLLVRDAMKSAVITAEPTMTVDRAAHIFKERGIHCLPVLEHGKLVGIVTSTDIENLAERGRGRPPYEGIEAEGYPPLHTLRGKSADTSGNDKQY